MDGFAHVSFVNGVSTPRGGTHLEHATRSLMGPLLKQLATKLKARARRLLSRLVRPGRPLSRHSHHCGRQVPAGELSAAQAEPHLPITGVASSELLPHLATAGEAAPDALRRLPRRQPRVRLAGEGAAHHAGRPLRQRVRAPRQLAAGASDAAAAGAARGPRGRARSAAAAGADAARHQGVAACRGPPAAPSLLHALRPRRGRRRLAAPRAAPTCRSTTSTMPSARAGAARLRAHHTIARSWGSSLHGEPLCGRVLCYAIGAPDCTLIVTEGLSAKTSAVAGLDVVGRAHFGVFPLRGKPLNVRGRARARARSVSVLVSTLSVLVSTFRAWQVRDAPRAKVRSYSMLCYAVLCCAVLCCAMLCYACYGQGGGQRRAAPPRRRAGPAARRIVRYTIERRCVATLRQAWVSLQVRAAEPAGQAALRPPHAHDRPGAPLPPPVAAALQPARRHTQPGATHSSVAAQDEDGAHIKGLVLSMLHHYWPVA